MIDFFVTSNKPTKLFSIINLCRGNVFYSRLSRNMHLFVINSIIIREWETTCFHFCSNHCQQHRRFDTTFPRLFSSSAAN